MTISYKNLAKFFRVLDPSMREKYVSVLCNIEMETYKYFDSEFVHGHLMFVGKLEVSTSACAATRGTFQIVRRRNC